MCIDESDSVDSLTKRRGYCFIGFGDFETFVPSDGYPFFCAGNTIQNEARMNHQWLQIGGVNSGYSITVISGLSVARDGIATAGAIHAIAAGINPGGTNGFGGFGNATTFPSSPTPGTNENEFCPAFLICGGILRGRMRGLFLPLNNMSANPLGTIFNGSSGVDTGSALALAIAGCNRSSSAETSVAYPLFETVLPW
jgi:hypothetical protein